MTTINQMIDSTKTSSCLIPFDYTKYGTGRFQNWFEENKKFSSNPCKLMDAFQTGLQRLAMEFSCLDGIPGFFFKILVSLKIFRKSERKMGK